MLAQGAVSCPLLLLGKVHPPSTARTTTSTHLPSQPPTCAPIVTTAAPLQCTERVYFSAATLQPEVQELPAFLEKMSRGGCCVRFLDLMEVPIFFNYRRSRYYKVLEITS
eukprot:GEMP01091739.1.p1 GENE.GEMP01091739.1~~GEMP01091739.1.p1  ORF type:complete len:110 (+),score=23.11 GEMP01091739.1:154-483(+)